MSTDVGRAGSFTHQRLDLVMPFYQPSYDEIAWLADIIITGSRAAVAPFEIARAAIESGYRLIDVTEGPGPCQEARWVSAWCALRLCPTNGCEEPKCQCECHDGE